MTKLHERTDLLFQLGRFGFVGIVATLTHVASAYFLYNFAQLSPVISNSGGFALAWIVAYFGHFTWTFESKAEIKESAVRFMLVSVFAFALNLAIVWLISNVLGQPFWLAILAVVLVVPAVTFTISKLWTFRAVSPPPTA